LEDLFFEITLLGNESIKPPEPQPFILGIWNAEQLPFKLGDAFTSCFSAIIACWVT
jgi:hypothetical protein